MNYGTLEPKINFAQKLTSGHYRFLKIKKKWAAAVMMMLDKLNSDLESLIEFFGRKIRYFMGWPWVQIQFSRFLAKNPILKQYFKICFIWIFMPKMVGITHVDSSIDFWDNLWSFGLILSKKVEFWNSFTFQAPLEIQDGIELWILKSNLIIKYWHSNEN